MTRTLRLAIIPVAAICISSAAALAHAAPAFACTGSDLDTQQTPGAGWTQCYNDWSNSGNFGSQWQGSGGWIVSGGLNGPVTVGGTGG
ncbi:hypothetical protein [Mycobacteroides abscessus]|uniref:hypothetical protein n=1 Tax=Mycobacteroides abscessus TaxID=36809 RepID=UPI0010426719|nr:hypothetical protein [Mycobacteroides abscessus]MDO3068968.1 hypothetical protein [Mycobacteroides abscessus subsp. bolletii]